MRHAVTGLFRRGNQFIWLIGRNGWLTNELMIPSPVRRQAFTVAVKYRYSILKAQS